MATLATNLTTLKHTEHTATHCNTLATNLRVVISKKSPVGASRGHGYFRRGRGQYNLEGR